MNEPKQQNDIQSVMHRALSAYQNERMEEAIGLCEEITRRRPENFGALYLTGAAHNARKRWSEALEALDRAIAIYSAHADCHEQRATALLELRRYEEAFAAASQALALDPGHARALNNQGFALQALGRLDEALSALDRALRINPAYPEVHNNRGNVLQLLSRFDEALAAYDAALALKPDYPEALNNRGAVLHELKRFEAALESYQAALSLRPGYAEAQNNRGVTLHDMERFDAALAAFDLAIAQDPAYADVWYNRANTLKRMLRFDEARQNFETALRLNPAHANALANAAMLELLHGNFAAGWPMYEGRWKTRELAPLRQRFGEHPWLGNEDIATQRLLVYAEQGQGDTLQFCRYLPLARARCRELFVEVQPSLAALLGPAFPQVTIIPGGSPLPAFDRYCPLMSLPLALSTTLETIPTATKLQAPATLRGTWAAKLGRRERPRVGLAWLGSPRHPQDARRSVPLHCLAPLFETKVAFHCLHKEPPVIDPVLSTVCRFETWCDDLHDFAQTAALIEEMDLVISVDTAVAHLAASMGKPTWIILAAIPDFRWMLERADSPWYPGARLFRQQREGDWSATVKQIRMALLDRFVLS